MQETEKQFNVFKGVFNSEDEKQTPLDYFRNCINSNYPDDGLLGMQNILVPRRIANMYENTKILPNQQSATVYANGASSPNSLLITQLAQGENRLYISPTSMIFTLARSQIPTIEFLCLGNVVCNLTFATVTAPGTTAGITIKLYRTDGITDTLLGTSNTVTVTAIDSGTTQTFTITLANNISLDYPYYLKFVLGLTGNELQFENIPSAGFSDSFTFNYTTSAYAIDGMCEYRFLDSNNNLQTKYVVVENGNINLWDLASTVTTLKTGLTVGKCSFAVFQDKLFIANGKNYVNVYWGSQGVISEMGAPAAVVTANAGNVNVGTHIYAMTYVTPNGEEVIGSVSNQITVQTAGKQVTLNILLGYNGVTARKIYRSVAGSTNLQYLDTVSDNKALTYTDNTADGSLGAAIPSTTVVGVSRLNLLPKVYHLAVAGVRLYGTKTDLYPTQVFATDFGVTPIEFWDLSNFIDVANYGGDNTAVVGIGFDYTNILVGTGKQTYMLAPSQTVVGQTSVIPTRANVGWKSGYTARSVPAFGDFPGGLMFVSSLNDVRLMQGVDTYNIPATLSNIITQNWAQNIRGDLNTVLKSYTNIYAEFCNNKYELAIDDITYIFDIRTQGWTYKKVKTTNYQSKPRVYAVLAGSLYNGQSNGYAELEYQDVKYCGEDVVSVIESPAIEVSRLYKMAHKFVLWFRAGVTSTMTIKVTLDDNTTNPITGNFTVTGPIYDSIYYDPTYFMAGTSKMDYVVFNIVKPCRWLKYVLTKTVGNIAYKGFSVVGYPLTNKEG